MAAHMSNPPAPALPIGEQRIEALGFKVMRLNRPGFFCPPPCLATSLVTGLKDDAAAGEGSDGWPIGASDSLTFPPGFGNIYLGETFSAYVSACNNSNADLSRVEIRAELQTGTKRITLLDGQASSFIPTFIPRDHVDYVLEHELKEAGVHIMICTASYLDSTGIERKARQYFKFQVQKPLSVTTKLHFMNNSVFLENQIQNITKRPLHLSLIKFEPTLPYIRKDLSDVSTPSSGHSAGDADGHAPAEKQVDDVFGIETHLNPGDVRQFLYELTPKEGNFDPHDKKMEELGRLEMSWKTGLGEPGRLHSLVNLHQWRLPPQQVVTLKAEHIPCTVNVQAPFEIEWSVQNRSPRELDLGLELSMEAGLSGPIVPLGICLYPLGILPPGATRKVKTQFVALQTGLRAIMPSDASVVDLASAASNAAPTRYPMANAMYLLVQPSSNDAAADT